MTDQPAHLLHPFCAAALKRAADSKPVGAVRPVNPATITALVAVTHSSSPTKYLGVAIARQDMDARMGTENLTGVLAAILQPVDAGRTTWRYTVGMAGGALAALILTAGVLHTNPALPHEVSEFAFWVRELYCASLGVLAVICVARLGRPGTRLGLFIP